jgi:hypothetical protein
MPVTTPDTPKKSFVDLQLLTKLQTKYFRPPATLFATPLSLTFFATNCYRATYRQHCFDSVLPPYMEGQFYLCAMFSSMFAWVGLVGHAPRFTQLAVPTCRNEVRRRRESARAREPGEGCSRYPHLSAADRTNPDLFADKIYDPTPVRSSIPLPSPPERGHHGESSNLKAYQAKSRRVHHSSIPTSHYSVGPAFPRMRNPCVQSISKVFKAKK